MDVRFYSGGAVDELPDGVGAIFDTMLHRTPCPDFIADDLIALARAGRAVIGVVTDDGLPVLAGAFEVRYYPRATAINIMAIGGTRLHEAIVWFWPTFRAWCIGAGANRIEASCAPAMTRLLQRYGFGHTANRLTQDLQ